MELIKEKELVERTRAEREAFLLTQRQDTRQSEREDAHLFAEQQRLQRDRQLAAGNEARLAAMQIRERVTRHATGRIAQSAEVVQERFPVHVRATIVRHGPTDTQAVRNQATVQSEKVIKQHWQAILNEMKSKSVVKTRAKQAKEVVVRQRGVQFLEEELKLLSMMDRAGDRVNRVKECHQVKNTDTSHLQSLHDSFEQVFLTAPAPPNPSSSLHHNHPLFHADEDAEDDAESLQPPPSFVNTPQKRGRLAVTPTTRSDLSSPGKMSLSPASRGYFLHGFNDNGGDEYDDENHTESSGSSVADSYNISQTQSEESLSPSVSESEGDSMRSNPFQLVTITHKPSSLVSSSLAEAVDTDEEEFSSSSPDNSLLSATEAPVLVPPRPVVVDVPISALLSLSSSLAKPAHNTSFKWDAVLPTVREQEVYHLFLRSTADIVVYIFLYIRLRIC
jgi:hypothetical protein